LEERMASDIIIDSASKSTPENKPTEKKRRKKIPGIYQRGGRWVIDTSYRFHKLRESFATFETAEANLRKLKTLIDEGRYMEKKKESKETLGDFADRYIKWCEDKREKAVYSKKSLTKIILAHFGKETLLSRITLADVESYQAFLMSSPSERKGEIKPATVNRRIDCLSGMMRKAVEWKVISENPCKGVKKQKENNEKTRFLTAEEYTTLLETAVHIDEGCKKGAISGATLKAIIEVAVHTGMRKGEILNLKWKHVHLNQGYLEIEGDQQKSGEYSTIKLNPIILEILRCIPRRLDSEYVFTGKIPGQPFIDVKGPFEKAVAKAKLEGVCFHTLRHTAASFMIGAGVELPSIMQILRHKDYKTTLRYAHLAEKHLQNAVNALGNALQEATTNQVKSA